MKKQEVQCQAETWQGRCQRDAFQYYGETYFPTKTKARNKWLCLFHYKYPGNIISYSELDREDLRAMDHKPSGKLFADDNMAMIMFGVVTLMLSPILLCQLIGELVVKIWRWRKCFARANNTKRA